MVKIILMKTSIKCTFFSCWTAACAQKIRNQLLWWKTSRVKCNGFCRRHGQSPGSLWSHRWWRKPLAGFERKGGAGISGEGEWSWRRQERRTEFQVIKIHVFRSHTCSPSFVGGIIGPKSTRRCLKESDTATGIVSPFIRSVLTPTPPSSSAQDPDLWASRNFRPNPSLFTHCLRSLKEETHCSVTLPLKGYCLLLYEKSRIDTKAYISFTYA